jgi:4-hydroxybenzoate polyprenyltransferase
VACAVTAAVAAGLTARWAGPDGAGGFSVTEALAFVLTAPVSIAALPLTLVVLGLAWNVTGADSGGPAWLLVLIYSLWFASLAIVNVIALTELTRGVRRSRARRRHRRA